MLQFQRPPPYSSIRSYIIRIDEIIFIRDISIVTSISLIPATTHHDLRFSSTDKRTNRFVGFELSLLFS